MVAVQHIDGTGTTRVCEKHAGDKVKKKVAEVKQKIKMRSRACSHEHCTEIARFGFCIIPRASLCRSRTFPEYAAPLYCEEHAPEGLVDIVEQRCADCPEIATMAKQGSGNAACCKAHAKKGMVPMCFRRGCRALAKMSNKRGVWAGVPYCVKEHGPGF